MANKQQSEIINGVIGEVDKNRDAVISNKTQIADLKRKGTYRGTYADLDAAKAAVQNPLEGDYVLTGANAPYIEYIWGKKDGAADFSWEQAGTAPGPTGVSLQEVAAQQDPKINAAKQEAINHADANMLMDDAALVSLKAKSLVV